VLLSDQDLSDALKSGELTVQPPGRGDIHDDIQPSSIDVHLLDELVTFDAGRIAAIDPRHEPPEYYTRRVQIDEFALHPGVFVLGATAEVVRLGDGLAARLEGKSSLGRLGLSVHATAGFIDPGFEGRVTLELSNLGPLPIVLHAGMPIGQLCVFRLSSPAVRPYGSPGLGSRYQGQLGPTPGLSWLDGPGGDIDR
jgi:dCTP deaminase